MSGVRSCPIEGCKVEIPRHLAMCKPHWSAVPQDLQRAVWRAYKNRGRPGGMARHLQALEDAEAAVEGREPVELFGDDDE